MAKYKYPILIKEMEQKRITQREIGKLLGIKDESVRNKLADKTEWTISEIEALCKFFKKSYYKLFKKED